MYKLCIKFILNHIHITEKLLVMRYRLLFFPATLIVDGDCFDRFRRCSSRIKHRNNASDLHKSKAHCPWSVSLLDVTICLCSCSEYEACSKIYFISLLKRRATKNTLSFYIKRFVYRCNVHLATDNVSANDHDENA